MDEDLTGYPEPPAEGDEATTLLGSLERQRATFAWKCAGLSREDLSRSVGVSTLTIGRLLKHLAYMEDLNFHRDLAGRPLPEPWSREDPDTRSEWVLGSADHDEPDVLYRLWQDAVARSRSAMQEALTRGDVGLAFRGGHGRPVTVRRLLVDMVEEYARHTGHADLIREAVDGRTGEDPPGPARPYALP